MINQLFFKIGKNIVELQFSYDDGKYDENFPQSAVIHCTRFSWLTPYCFHEIASRKKRNFTSMKNTKCKSKKILSYLIFLCLISKKWRNEILILQLIGDVEYIIRSSIWLVRLQWNNVLLHAEEGLPRTTRKTTEQKTYRSLPPSQSTMINDQ